MSESTRLTPQEELELTYACKILDAVAESFDSTAANPLNLIKSETFPSLPPLPAIELLSLELMQKYPEILDALLTITREDCRIVLHDFCQSIYKLGKLWLSLKAQQKQKTL